MYIALKELYFEMVYKKKLESYERGFEKDALELRFLPYFSLSFDDVHAIRFVCLCLFILNRKTLLGYISISSHG